MPLKAHLQNEFVDVLEKSERYEEVDGHFKFTGTIVVYRKDNNLYHAISESRFSSTSDVRADHLTNSILVPAVAYCPPFSPHFMRAAEPLPGDCFVKRPSLTSYDKIYQDPQPTSLADQFLAEVKLYEILKQHPHPNIVTYLGCQISDGRITGICFPKYQRTLMRAANPGSHMKRKLRSIRQGEDDHVHMLDGVEAGIQHLHSLGLVHNDINPSNIMIHGDKAIIIDFGSCRRPGEDLNGVGRTYEWYDETVKVSNPENDLNALEEMRIWLGNDSREFQFPE